MQRLRLPIDPYFVAGALSIVLVGGAVAWRGRSTPPPLPALPAAVFDRLDAAGAGVSLGSPSAPVHVATLSDYECEGCALAHARVWPVVERYVRAGAVRYTAYQTPLPRHRAGVRAAVAAGCVAERSPGAFWAYHAALYAAQAQWLAAPDAGAALAGLAGRAGADTLRLRGCLEREGAGRAARVERSWAMVKEGGVDLVPLWTVDGRSVSWLRLDREIHDALRKRVPAPEPAR
ncbi:MAG TPA: thioredoxin domain-containing protein [Longimicrobium sp.]|nr:thioredoxin domain-containing protein [Longimicrobium sp.]